jgi:hypothetical protein
MCDPPSPHPLEPLHQISAATIAHYRAYAQAYRDGTWNHDVSQNVEALLGALAMQRRLPGKGAAPAEARPASWNTT